ncbi:unnamed protein product, partial [Ixodes pacificus]
HTSSGSVVGVGLRSEEKNVNAYLGIPYAEPPIGKLRFKRPSPIPAWKGVLLALHQPRGCVQTDFAVYKDQLMLNMSTTVENCLFLNVWVPRGNTTDGKPFPVFVYLYGGQFSWGSANLHIYDGAAFATRAQVIYVTLNYRVGILGFLNASSPEAPGNMGLYDQLEALRWISKNIQFFGGDPNAVTLVGHSAGAISVGYHMISQLSKGLFQRAVLLSGTPPCLAYADHVDQRENFRTVSEALNCHDSSKNFESQLEASLECLRKLDAHALLSAMPVRAFLPKDRTNCFGVPRDIDPDCTAIYVVQIWFKICTCSSCFQSQESPIVETSYGPVQGMRVYAENRSLHAFLGIPFAEPPVGELRFRKPIPAKPWRSVYHATKKPFPCLQTDFYINNNVTVATANSTEDCLYLNVWTPARECVLGKSSCVLKTTIVYIHGGTFSFGSSGWDWYDGKEFTSRGDVVMVSMNYRVGPLGFLNSGTSHSSGNAGLHDQLLAMKWVKENIRNFGGNPDDITLLGQSAGAISIGLHLISPMSKGLFKRVIMESGSPYFRIADNTKEGPHKVEKLARALSCAANDMTIESHMPEMVNCLRKVDGKELLIMANTLFGVHALTFFPIYGDDIIPDDPYKMMEQKKFHKADLLIGTNQDEGSYFVFFLFGRVLTLDMPHKITKYEVDLYVTYCLQMLLRRNVSPIRNYYLGHLSEKENIKALQKAAEAVGDYAIVCPTKYFAETFSSMSNKVHYYQFTHRPTFSTWPGWVGPTHGDEVAFVFGQPFSSPTIATDQERDLSKLMMETWTTFAKTG